MKKVEFISVSVVMGKDQPVLLTKDGRWLYPEEIPSEGMDDPVFVAGYIKGIHDRLRGLDYRCELKEQKIVRARTIKD